MNVDVKRCGITSPALLFPGVGVKPTGREWALFEAYPSVFSPLFERASDFSGTDLSVALRHNAIPSLSALEGQFFTYAFSVGAASVARTFVTPCAVAGYSFGIYAALRTADVISFEDGLRILERAHTIMNDIAESGSYGMAVILGLSALCIVELIDTEALHETSLTNSNHEACHVCSGPSAEIDHLLAAAQRRGALKFQKLDVDIPYHHPSILREAPERLRAVLDSTSWQPAEIPIISSIDGAPMEAAEPIVKFVSKHLSHPINWLRVCETLHRRGVDGGIECGPGISLSQNARFLPFEMKMINVKKAAACLTH